jgi:ATP synthase protein I
VGYRLVAELVSGVLGGLGLGWLADHFVGTSPFGLIVGGLGGAIASIVLVVWSASRMTSDQARPGAPADPAPLDDEEDV